MKANKVQSFCRSGLARDATVTIAGKPAPAALSRPPFGIGLA
jgi:hypothetical protein